MSMSEEMPVARKAKRPDAKPHAARDHAVQLRRDRVSGSGVVRAVDKAGGKIRLTHEPIAAMGWPRMTLFFRFKERSLADQVKEGDRIEFTLEKLASGYVIATLEKTAPSGRTAQVK